MTAIEEPLLAADDIQGDSLAGFRKDHEDVAFLRIVDPGAARAALGSIVPRISPVGDVGAFNHLFRAMRRRRGEIRGSLSATWANIGFTASGLAALTSQAEVDRFEDDAFRLGLLARSPLLGDPTAADARGNPRQWRFGGPDSAVDAVLLVASDDGDALENTAGELLDALTSGGWALVHREPCRTRPDQPGHEHFGFRDGISQPGPRGRIGGGQFLTPRLVDPADPRSVRFARPGQPLVWPGAYVLGLPGQPVPPDDDLQPLPVQAPQPAWAQNGSFLIVRRLSQDVAAFRRFCAATAASLSAKPGFAGLTADRLAALLVGRWPSGAPLVRAPAADDAALGGDDFAANDFAFVNAHPPLPLTPAAHHGPDLFPAAIADPGGAICPHAAHIRKVNPRDDETDLGGSRNTLPKMILRRGMPFGPSAPADGSDDGADRGLMFMCYTASIERSFEFLLTDWANSAHNPQPGGNDLLIGQAQDAASGRARSLELIGADGSRETVSTDVDWVYPTGGGYFFVPSITALRTVLAASGGR
jgi:Dyp-type peroxidase family